MFAFLRRMLHPRRFVAWSVDHERGGYRAGDMFVARADVEFIVAYRRDLITIDQLCLGIAYGWPDANKQCAALHIEEDNPSYKEILADLEGNFDLREGWWHEVTREPFTSDKVTIWQRSAASGSMPSK